MTGKKGYVFRVLLSDGSIAYSFIDADNIRVARDLFKSISSFYSDGWCLIGVYR